jgi:hypothetical protein
MNTVRKSALGVAAASTLLCSAVSARADGPMILTGGQLDRVTAGAATVTSSTDAQAVGALSLAATTSNSVVNPGTSQFTGQPGFASSIGAADGTALAVGTNVTVPGAPPPSSSTSVTTAGTAAGNVVIISTTNHTVQGAGGVTFQAGWTVAFGAFVGL